MAGFGAEPFRARQLWHWIYHRGVTDFAVMTSLAKGFRERLAERYELRRPEISRALASLDGTRKWLLRFDDAQEIETVHIPEADRGTLCVSSQVGCTLTCTFCHTGTQRLVRNLTASEIVGQILVARDALGEWPSPQEDRWVPCSDGHQERSARAEATSGERSLCVVSPVTTIREPVPRRVRNIFICVTVEFCPSSRMMNVWLKVRPRINASGELRNTLVPLNKKYPIAELLEACRSYPGSSNARRITFEYVMLKGVNDSPAEARELVRLLKGIPAKVNLIPFNPWPGAPYECSSDKAIKAFSDIVFEAGYSAPVRTPRGRDILAACGQLKSESVRARRTVSAPAPQPEEIAEAPLFG